MTGIGKMVAGTEWVLSHLAGQLGPVIHQILLIAVIAPLLWVALYFSRRRTQRWLPLVLRWATIGFACVVIIPYAHLIISYAIAPNYVRYEEPFVHCLALLFARGDALYPSLNDAARYGGPYGPMLYIVNALVLITFGSGQHILKVFNGLLLFGGAIALFAAVRKTAGTALAVASSALLCAILADAQDFPLSIRGDALIVFCVALAILAVQYRRTVPIAALAAAVAINIKVHAVLYFLPLLAFAWGSYGAATALYGLVIAFVVTAAPFALPNVSLTNYVSWLRLTGSLRPTAWLLAPNLAVVSYLLTPLACVSAVRTRLRYSLRLSPAVLATTVALVLSVAFVIAPLIALLSLLSLFLFVACLATVACVVIAVSLIGSEPGLPRSFVLLCSVLGPVVVIVSLIASKPGAGQWHLLPFAPILLWMAAVMARDIRLESGAVAIIVGFAIAAAVSAHTQSASVYRLIDISNTPGDVTPDIENILRGHQGISMQMGYGGQDPESEEAYALSYYRPMLVARGFPYTIDPVSIETSNASHSAMPSSAFASLARCETRLWLIPRGRPPFLLRSRYNRSNLFSGFREEFLRTHELRDHSRYFDLWSCVHHPGIGADAPQG